MICQRPGLKARAWKSRLLVPPPDRGDVVTHGGLVQLEAELAVGGGWPAAVRMAKLGQRSPGVIMGGLPVGQRAGTATATHYMLVF